MHCFVCTLHTGVCSGPRASSPARAPIRRVSQRRRARFTAWRRDAAVPGPRLAFLPRAHRRRAGRARGRGRGGAGGARDGDVAVVGARGRARAGRIPGGRIRPAVDRPGAGAGRGDRAGLRGAGGPRRGGARRRLRRRSPRRHGDPADGRRAAPGRAPPARRAHGLLVEPEGGLLVAEAADGRVLRRDPAGTVAVLASRLGRPRWLAGDPGGTLFIATTGRRDRDHDHDDDHDGTTPWDDRILARHPDGTLTVWADRLAPVRGLAVHDGALHALVRGKGAERPAAGLADRTRRAAGRPRRPGAAGAATPRGPRDRPARRRLRRRAGRRLEGPPRPGPRGDRSRGCPTAAGSSSPRGWTGPGRSRFDARRPPVGDRRRRPRPAAALPRAVRARRHGARGDGGVTAHPHRTGRAGQPGDGRPRGRPRRGAGLGPRRPRQRRLHARRPPPGQLDERPDRARHGRGGPGTDRAADPPQRAPRRPAPRAWPSSRRRAGPPCAGRSPSRRRPATPAAASPASSSAWAAGLSPPSPIRIAPGRWCAAVSLDTTGLADGVHTLSATAADVAGNVTTTSQSFTVDNAPPETSLTGGPSGESGAASATFSFTGSDGLTPPGAVEFAWRLDDGPWSEFGTEATVTLTDLAAGAHVFSVRARDRAGNEDPTPVEVVFTVQSLRVTIEEPAAAGLPRGGNGPRARDGGRRPPGGEVVVRVNGALASVSGTRWAAEIGLEAGPHVVSASASGPGGTTAASEVAVTMVEGPASGVVLSGIPGSGVAPREVRWEVASLSGVELVWFELDETGTGTFGPARDHPRRGDTTYDTPGLWFPVVRAWDAEGYRITWPRPSCTSRDPEEVTARVQRVWSGFTGRLQAGDVEGALTYLVPGDPRALPARLRGPRALPAGGRRRLRPARGAGPGGRHRRGGHRPGGEWRGDAVLRVSSPGRSRTMAHRGDVAR